MKIYARVAMEFDVDKLDFQTDKDRSLREALLNGRAVLSDGDNYAPESWNESIFEDDYSFSLGVHPVVVPSKTKVALDKFELSIKEGIQQSIRRRLEVLDQEEIRLNQEYSDKKVQAENANNIKAIRIQNQLAANEIQNQLDVVIANKIKFFRQLRKLKD